MFHLRPRQPGRVERRPGPPGEPGRASRHRIAGSPGPDWRPMKRALVVLRGARSSSPAPSWASSLVEDPHGQGHAPEPRGRHVPARLGPRRPGRHGDAPRRAARRPRRPRRRAWCRRCPGARRPTRARASRAPRPTRPRRTTPRSTLEGARARSSGTARSRSSTPRRGLAHQVEPERSLSGPRRRSAPHGRSRVWPARASILAADGSVLAGDAGVVQIGLEPDHIKTPGRSRGGEVRDEGACSASTRATIDKVLHAPGVQPELLPPGRERARRDADVPAHPRRCSCPIPGIIFQRRSGRRRGRRRARRRRSSAASATITADRLKQLGAPYAVGDQVGLSGLQNGVREAARRDAEHRRRDRRRARARPSARSSASRARRRNRCGSRSIPRSQTAAEDRARRRHQERGPRRDRHDDRRDPRRRLEARRRLRPRARGHLPARLDVQGHHVGRAARRRRHRLDARAVPGDDHGRRPSRSRTSRARRRARSISRTRSQISCNNAFIGLADKLPADALGQGRDVVRLQRALVARRSTRAGGSYPTPSDRAERAASAIGQGRVLASPVQMASVAAAVASGQWRAPTLVTAPAPAAGPVVAPLAPAVDATLKSFMASVVRRRRHRGRRGPARRLVRQDRHRRVRQRQSAADPRVVHRLPRRSRVRGDRRGRRRRRPRSPRRWPPGSSATLPQ